MKNEKRKYSQIFFLSREGKIIRQAYEIFYPELKNHSYLHVSRKALLVPLLAESENYDEMMRILAPFMRTTSVENICNLLEISEKELRENIGEKVFTGDISKKVDKQKFFKYIKKYGQTKFELQERALKEYLMNNDFYGKIAVCDIGWHGTMQSVLQSRANKETIIEGLYLGVRSLKSKEKQYQGMKRYGFLFEDGKNEEYDYATRFTNEVLELLFLNDDGSVQKYDYDSNHIAVPIHSKSEYTVEEVESIKRMQNSALFFIEECKKVKWLFNNLNISPETVMEGYMNMAENPKLSTINFFSNFNTVDEKIKKITPEHTIFYYLFFPRKFREDIENHCKIFTLKKLFKLPLPYMKILKILIGKFGMKSNYRRKFFN